MNRAGGGAVYPASGAVLFFVFLFVMAPSAAFASSWYGGLSLGSGAAYVSMDGDHKNYGAFFDDDRARRFCVGAFAGVELDPKFRLGMDWTAMRTQSPDDFFDGALQHTQVLVSGTWKPQGPGHGVFLRGGAGWARFRMDLEKNAAGVALFATSDGLGSSVGVGYGFQVTDSFVLTLANDVHLGFFFDSSDGAPTHAWFSNFNLGLLWN